MVSVVRFIERRLRLKVNQAKSAVAQPEERHFVGFSLRRKPEDGSVEVFLSKRSKVRIDARIRELTPRAWGQSLRGCIATLNTYLRGWLNFFGTSCTDAVTAEVLGLSASMSRRSSGIHSARLLASLLGGLHMRNHVLGAVLVSLTVLEPAVSAQRLRPPAADPFDDLASMMIGEALAEDIHSIVSGVASVRRSAQELSRQIAAARQAFWAVYPDGPQFSAAETNFARLLTEKDLLIVSMYIVGAGRSNTGCASAEAKLTGDLLAINQIDGGIPTMAWLSFCDWVNAIRREIRSFSDLMTWGITAMKLPAYASYKQGRDWAEFHRAGKAKYSSWADFLQSSRPEQFVFYLVWGGVKSSERRLAFPEALLVTQEYVSGLVQQHGRERVFGAVPRLMDAPKVVVDPDPAHAMFMVNRTQLADISSVGCRFAYIEQCSRIG
jgi:hypothetical protein